MVDPTRPRSSSTTHLRRGRSSWCCSFALPPSSPENPSTHLSKIPHRKNPIPNPTRKPGPNSVPSSPQSSKSSSGLNFMTRRILSPGRVSPIDSDPVQELFPLPPDPDRKAGSESFWGKEKEDGFSSSGSGAAPDGGIVGVEFDVSLIVKGRKGGTLVLELNSEVLVANSEVFSGLILKHGRAFGSLKSSGGGGGGSRPVRMCRIEVGDVENLGVFRDTIELMFEEDIVKRLVQVGVYRAIGILEVSAGIMFIRGVTSCLKYLEVVPWTEEEEQKLRRVVTTCKFEETSTQEILARLRSHASENSKQQLSRQLVLSVTGCTDANARNEMKTLVKGLLCKTSVYERDELDLSKEEIYAVCQSCLASLISLMEEASGAQSLEKAANREVGKPLIERISRQVDNINWLLEILLDRQMGEEFVDTWANQHKLLNMHESVSPMIRYELSRVSAVLFMAMGTRKLHCTSESRAALFEGWFGPMLVDYGWLQRCKKGLEMKVLEEALGQTLLTLPLKQQYVLFMEWFRFFSKHGNECPNLGKAFQIWWRRSFQRGLGTNAIESSLDNLPRL